MSRTVLLCGGGTGGHVFPLIALAESIAALAPELTLAFVGTEKGLEAKVVRERGLTLYTIDVEPLKGRSMLASIRGGMIAGAAVVQALSLVMRLRPILCVSIGGYAAGPVAAACRALAVPLALLEPNRVAGLTQRLLTPLATRIYVAFPEAIANSKSRAFGIPLRSGFSPVLSWRAPGEPLRVLVMGGSQGADHLNRTLPEAFAASGARLSIVHQAGRGRADEVRALYAAHPSAGVKVEVLEFIDDVAARLAATHLVVSRSGALTCAEICAVGRAAILIPYPFAADDHQAENARALEQAGAAIAIRQSDASRERLAEAIAALDRDEPRRARMCDAAKSRGRPDAAERIARDLLDLVGVPPRSPVRAA